MTIEIKNRKNTTEKGLNAIETLLEKINEDLRQDIVTLNSKLFECGYKDDNGNRCGDYNYATWVNIEAHLQICNGEICIISGGISEYEGYPHDDTTIDYPQDIKTLDFSGFWDALQELIEKYNKACKEKDAEVSEFLAKIEALTN